MQPTLTHLFFDVGGVLGTSGWDYASRTAAAETFGLDPAHLEARHQSVVTRFEEGRLTLGDYITAVTDGPTAPVNRDVFEAFMFSRSVVFPEVVAIAQALSRDGRYCMMTINNESAELNTYRLHHFGLVGVFSGFFSSCWLGAAKPSREIYELALSISQARPECSVFIDDREENLPPAHDLGMHTILFQNAGQLIADLAALGADHPSLGADHPSTFSD